jgi:hypothetical protein
MQAERPCHGARLRRSVLITFWRLFMDAVRNVRVLVVTDHAAASPELLVVMRDRAAQGSTQFRVLVTNPARTEVHALHPERHDKAEEAERALRTSIAALQEAAGAAVIGSVSVRHDPYLAVEELLASEPVDEFIVALAPSGLTKRLHLDLAHRLAHLGRPITSVGLVTAD